MNNQATYLPLFAQALGLFSELLSAVLGHRWHVQPDNAGGKQEKKHQGGEREQHGGG